MYICVYIGTYIYTYIHIFMDSKCMNNFKCNFCNFLQFHRFSNPAQICVKARPKPRPQPHPWTKGCEQESYWKGKGRGNTQKGI